MCLHKNGVLRLVFLSDVEHLRGRLVFENQMVVIANPPKEPKPILSEKICE